MTVVELIKRFREIPPDLHHEPILEEFAATFDDLLQLATKPSNCTTQYSDGHYYYMALIAPMGIYGFRLCSRDDCLDQIKGLIDRYRNDPAEFTAGLIRSRTAGSGG